MSRDPVAEWQALSRLYEEADALDAPGLAGFLADRRARGDALLPKLERMLAARDAARRSGFLDSVATLVAEPDDDPADGAGVASRSRAGQRLGPWRLLQPIGAGGMAEVWLAERADGAFERRVAVKLLHELPGRHARTGWRERFRRERAILAGLDHPHIAALQDAGITEDGQPWLAVELVDGAPITAWCDARRLDVRARVALFRQVLQAVEHAHARLVVHRDLKPSNVFVTVGGDVKLLDFGIAKLQPADATTADDTALTRLGGRPLTLRYASPEQRNGEPVTVAADIYSATVLLHELLTGRVPIEWPQAPAFESEALALDAASRRMPDAAALAARGGHARAWRRALAGDLDAVLARGLAFHPADRYPDARSLREDLERWLEGRPVRAQRTSAWRRGWKWARRHRVASVGGTVATLAIAGLAIVSTWQGLRARAGEARAVLARDFVVDLFQLADPQGQGGRALAPRELLAAGEQRALESLRGDPLLQADVLRRIAVMQGYAGDHAAAGRNLARVAQAYESDGRVREAFEVALEQAANAVQRGVPDEAARHLDVAAALLPAVRDQPVLAGRYWVRRAAVDRLAGRHQVALEASARGIALLETALGPDHVDVVDALRGQALTEQRLNRHDAAEATLRDAAARAARNPAVGARDRVAIGASLAVAAFRAGRYDGLGAHLQSLLGRCERDIGAGNDQCVLLAGYLGLLGLRLDDAGLRRAAAPRLVQALAADASPWRRAGALNVLAPIATLDRLASPAPAEIDAALARVVDGDLPPRDRRNARLALAMRAVLAGDGAAAEAWLQPLRGSRTTSDAAAAQGGPTTVTSANSARSGSADAEFDARVRVWHGLALERRGRFDAARTELDAGAGAFAALHGEHHVLTLLAQGNRAAFLARRGDADSLAPLQSRVTPALRRAVGDAPVVATLEGLRAAAPGTSTADASPTSPSAIILFP